MKMKVQILSREFIKPSTPTPPSLKNYKISLVDELSPTMNIPLILYYPATKNISTCNHLKASLAATLSRFYVLAGRYVKDSYTVDCSDQGAEYVRAQVQDIRLSDLIDQGPTLKVELLNDLIPIPVGAADEITDPLLAIQVNVFDCGGLAIAVCGTHRVVDVSSLTTFINEWAKVTASWDTPGIIELVSPSFESVIYFPGKNISGMFLELPRHKENTDHQAHKIITRTFRFDVKAISSIKGDTTSVQTVFGIIWKAIVDIDKAAKHGQYSSTYFIVRQAVNMRERTLPPLSKHAFGNLYALSNPQFLGSERDMEFQDFADLLGNSVKSTLEDCAKMLSCGEEGQMMLINPITDLKNMVLAKPAGMVNVSSFSSWCRFPFYETDFGWGKPIWVSTTNIPIQNSVILMDDKEGKRIEAWVSLNEKDMPTFQENCTIKSFTT